MIKTTILVVDDRPENILALSKLLGEFAETDILTATSGEMALSLLLDHEIALALIDVQMPGMDGFELARLMRGTEIGRQIPIIFVTATRTTQAGIFEAYEKGGVDFLLKPLDPHIVRSKVAVFLELDQQRRRLKAELAAKDQLLVQMQQLKSEAEAASKAKSRFLANMSHEIRTPLGAILGFAELLSHPEELASGEQQNCVATICRNGQLLSKLIDDILDLSKVEAEKLEIEKIPLSLPELIDDVRAVLGLRAAEKGLSFAVECDGPVPQAIVSDPFRLRQIIQNVAGNAIKFTAQGGVTVRISYGTGPFSRHHELTFTVTDTGCGLSAQEAARLFVPFSQADSSTSRLYGGTGLGLVIARQLAMALGGDVRLRSSAPNQGSVFVISIDPGVVSLQAAGGIAIGKQPRPEAAAADVDLQGVSVLLVDDSPDNLVLVSRFLRFAGATVDCAKSGFECLEKAFAGNHHLILLDMQMPGMDGYEAARSLRRSQYQKPILALTAHAMKDELDLCLAAGCDDYMSKPVDRRLLIRRVRTFVDAGRPQRTDAQATVKKEIVQR